MTSIESDRAFIKQHLLNIRIGVGSKKKCGDCGELRLYSEYHKEPRGLLGIRSDCRYCASRKRAAAAKLRRLADVEGYRARERERHRAAYHDNKNGFKDKVFARCAARRVATRSVPPWDSMENVSKVYEGVPKGMHVDHIYPVKSKYVCGLHTVANLQVLPAAVNHAKGNKLPGEWAHELWESDPLKVFYG